MEFRILLLILLQVSWKTSCKPAHPSFSTIHQFLQSIKMVDDLPLRFKPEPAALIEPVGSIELFEPEPRAWIEPVGSNQLFKHKPVVTDKLEMSIEPAQETPVESEPEYVAPESESNPPAVSVYLIGLICKVECGPEACVQECTECEDGKCQKYQEIYKRKDLSANPVDKAESIDSTTTEAESIDATISAAESIDATTTEAESIDAMTTEAESIDALTTDATRTDALKTIHNANSTEYSESTLTVPSSTTTNTTTRRPLLKWPKLFK